jgi:MinD superfamily P-loop ATPase
MEETKNIKIAVASGKGGTGKTFVATNLFYSLWNSNYDVGLVDCDAEEPNDTIFIKGDLLSSTNITQKVPVIDGIKCTFCGKCRQYCNYNAIFLLSGSKIIKVIEDLCHGCGACSVACEYGAITEKDVVQGAVNSFRIDNEHYLTEARMKVGVLSPVPIIKAAINESGENNIKIMDAPPGTSCPFIQTVARADYIVLVTEPTPFGLSDLQQSVNTLDGMGKRYGVIINRAGLGDTKIYGYLKTNNIPLLMEIGFDKKIAYHYSKGELIAKEDFRWREKFINLFNNILEHYGDSSN